MPQVIGPTDFQLTDKATNNRVAVHLLGMRKAEILEDTETYVIVKNGDIKTGSIAVINKNKMMVNYLVRYRSKDYGLLGRFVTQFMLWRQSGIYYVKGMTSKIFFECLLSRWDTVASDGMQTGHGKRFWLDVMGEAIQKGYAVGYFNELYMKKSICFYEGPVEDYITWIYDNHMWSDEDKFKTWRYFITKDKDLFIKELK